MKQKLFSKTEIEAVLNKLGVPSIKKKVYQDHTDLFGTPVYQNYSVTLYTQQVAIQAILEIADAYIRIKTPERILKLLEEVHEKYSSHSKKRSRSRKKLKVQN